MRKLILAIALIAIGVAIGIKYQSPIMDTLNLRDMEDVKDSIEDATDGIQNTMDSLSDTVTEMGHNL